jgi:hypothetical protein
MAARRAFVIAQFPPQNLAKSHAPGRAAKKDKRFLAGRDDVVIVRVVMSARKREVSSSDVGWSRCTRSVF